MAVDDMEDVDVATKAPESDAQEHSSATGAPQTQEQSTLGEHCTTDRPAPAGAEPKGEITTIGGVKTYIAKPTFYPSQPAKLLLLLSPGTGIDSPNNQLQADQWATEGYVVIMPDQFDGDAVPRMDTSPSSTSHTGPTPPSDTTPAVPPAQAQAEGGIAGTEGSSQPPASEAPASGPTQAEGTISSWVNSLKQTVLDTAKSFRIDMWLARHTPATVLPRLIKVLDAVHAEYADAVAYGGGVYGVGYCFGGRYVLLLSGEVPDDVVGGSRDVGSASVVNASSPAAQNEGEGKKQGLDTEPGMKMQGPWLKAAVLAHGTGIGREDFAGLKEGARLGVVAVKEDVLFTDEVREFGIKVAKEKGVGVEEKVWEGVPHGFAVVGEYKDQKIVDAQREAHEFMTSFLKSG